MELIWSKVLTSIEKRVNAKTFSSWIRPMQFLESNDDTVTLAVPDRFTRDWISDHGLKDIVEEEFQALCNRPVSIVLRIVEGMQDLLADQALDVPAASEPAPVSEQERLTPTSAPEEEHLSQLEFNSIYTFANFVVGPSNQMVFAACQNVAENLAVNYNPLFIYGGSGLGKTHLLTSMAHRILELNRHARIIYTSTETFVNEFIKHIRFKTMDQFQARYRSQCDVLLIDDIQFISNKKQTQEEFFHTFNTLHDSRRQIVISSDRPPQEIPELEDRLRTRFQWGLVVDIQIPEIETRVAILLKKAEAEGLEIPDDVAMFIAGAARTSVREIEGSLKRLGAFSSLYGRPITLEFAKEVLRDTLGTTQRLAIDDVIKSVANFFNVKSADLKSSRRHRSISRPRQIAMYICRQYIGSSYPEIGSKFNKDHSTAIAAIRNIDKIMAADSSTREAVEAIKRQLGL